ncbi:MAG: TetR/AcrR family transcriptional regulator [Inconstantimicrobium porci]|uniref:TetR/AcrR family transcriptional regulator n=1 Tax=Inconstantimicrobium porci TaxID=2652291 RepID=A0A7X2N010_9CLOT|nr:TetR/AcrR family transcriptional regulator [Inconstantimicrobium porci]MDD6770186.1 TetR/AcrR family transcriptional regulator [Inconstantimicrobium porci]MDY5913378.1 TetR/AcrR family transcriptional regulator [Inconstantimicrobium porci]MSR92231.1 TetR/AcrR family transcriptional regulator [Inconstantimicrobium porci]
MEKSNLKQKRSIVMRENILSTALKLFCEKGYHNVTTNEIAKVCGISIGSLYFHFKNKDEILLQILDTYHRSFIEDMNERVGDSDVVLNKTNIEQYLHILINSLIDTHEKSKAFNKELMALSFTKDEVAEILCSEETIEFELTKKYIKSIDDCKKISDMDNTVYVILDIINSTVNRVVFKPQSVDKEKLIKTAVDAIVKILY